MASSGIIYNIQRFSTEDGPGIRTTVFFKGCPLRCLWCSNPESQSITPEVMVFDKLCTNCGRCVPHCPHDAIVDIHNDKGTFKGRNLSLCTECGQCIPYCPSKAREMSGRLLTVEEVMKEIRKDESFYRNSGGGVTFGGGECTMQGAFLLNLMDACIQDCLATLLQKHPEKTIVRMPLMPGLNDSEENIRSMADFLLPYRCSSVEVMPCHTFGHSKYEACGRPVPDIPQYTPEELNVVLKRFSQYGL